MELRFLKGNWKFGKFKLQYRTLMHPNGFKFSHWMDVPVVEEEKLELLQYCPMCGAKKP